MSVGCEGGDVTYNLKIDASEATANIRELNRLLTTYVALARRMGLPENIIDTIARIQQLRVAIQTLYRAIILLQTATTPVGWFTALGGVFLFGFMLLDQMEMRRPRY